MTTPQTILWTLCSTWFAISTSFHHALPSPKCGMKTCHSTTPHVLTRMTVTTCHCKNTPIYSNNYQIHPVDTFVVYVETIQIMFFSKVFFSCGFLSLVERPEFVDSQESTNKSPSHNLSIFHKNLQITYSKTRTRYVIPPASAKRESRSSP